MGRALWGEQIDVAVEAYRGTAASSPKAVVCVATAQVIASRRRSR